MRDDNQGAKRDIQLELKALRLNGMAAAWAELTAQGGDSTLNSSRWLIEHLLQAEDVDRVMRSIEHQMKAARFPMHRDMAGFDFEASQVDQALIQKLANLSFTEDAQNVVLIGGPGTGKTHLATALGISGLTRHGQARAVLLHDRSGQCLGAGKIAGQGGPDCLEPDAHGPGHPR